MEKITNMRTGGEICTSNLTEIAPGVFIGDIPQKEMPRYGVTKFVKDKEGKIHGILRTWDGMAKITKKLPEQLGVNLSSRVLRTLVYAGLVKGSRPTPFITEIDLADLARHRAHSSKPNFWNERRRSAYNLAWSFVQLCKFRGEGEAAEEEESE